MYERESGSAVLEAPRPPNSLLSISVAARTLGTCFPPMQGGGGKNTSKQMQKAAGQCTSVHAIFLNACGFLATGHAHACMCTWAGGSSGSSARPLAPEVGEFCLHIDEPATSPLCPRAPFKQPDPAKGQYFSKPPIASCLRLHKKENAHYPPPPKKK